MSTLQLLLIFLLAAVISWAIAGLYAARCKTSEGRLASTHRGALEGNAAWFGLTNLTLGFHSESVEFIFIGCFLLAWLAYRFIKNWDG